jgi:hypothetical protein
MSGECSALLAPTSPGSSSGLARQESQTPQQAAGGLLLKQVLAMHAYDRLRAPAQTTQFCPNSGSA